MLYDSAFVEAIVSTFGYFVAVDNRTKACVSVKYARACVELDVTRPIPDSAWISLLNDKGFWHPIEAETNLSYCNKCKVHGHTIGTCRKAKISLFRRNPKAQIPSPNRKGTTRRMMGQGKAKRVRMALPKLLQQGLTTFMGKSNGLRLRLREERKMK